MADTLHALAEEVDEQRYVSREDVAARIGALLKPDSSQRILIFHGPGGIGKSAVLREAARDASRSGYSTLWLDGRRLAETASIEELAGTDSPAGRSPRVVIIDETDALGAGIHALGTWVSRLPESARVIMAGRKRPPRDWLGEGLERLAATCRLTALDDEHSRTLLRRLGMEEPDRIESSVRWAQGSPLALVIARAAAENLTVTAERELSAADLGPGVIDELVERIAGDALSRDDRELLRAASISWSVDEALLAAVLPECDGKKSLGRLVELDFVERLGDRGVVHPIVAKTLVEQMQIEDPKLFRDLTMRTASHLRDRAVDGDSSALADLANLVRDPLLRDGLGPAYSEFFYADRVRAGDLEEVRTHAGKPLSEALSPWLRMPAGHCLIARLGSGQCVGAGVAFGAHAASSVAATDELAGPLIEFSTTLEEPERAVISPFQLVFDGGDHDRRNDLMRYMNAIAVMRCGVPNPRYDIVNGIGWTRRDEEVASRFGYEEIPRLRRTINGHEVGTWFADSGGGGLAGLIYGAIASENGIELASGGGWADVALNALEAFHDDAALASLPVAPHGHDQADAAAIVRDRMRDMVARALAAEPELLAIIEARYLVPGQTHDGAMQKTFQSRSGYYRKLRRARQAIVAAC